MKIRLVSKRSQSGAIFISLVSICGALVLPAVMLCGTVILRPVEIRDILVNPGMGVQTFQRYNGDALNSGVEWSEEGPTGPLKAPSQAPDFPPSTVAYCRWHWATLEPEQGKVHWDIIDLA